MVVLIISLENSILSIEFFVSSHDRESQYNEDYHISFSFNSAFDANKDISVYYMVDIYSFSIGIIGSKSINYCIDGLIVGLRNVMNSKIMIIITECMI